MLDQNRRAKQPPIEDYISLEVALKRLGVEKLFAFSWIPPEMDVMVADVGEACDAGTAERSERADPFVDHGDRDIGLLIVGERPVHHDAVPADH